MIILLLIRCHLVAGTLSRAPFIQMVQSRSFTTGRCVSQQTACTAMFATIVEAGYSSRTNPLHVPLATAPHSHQSELSSSANLAVSVSTRQLDC